MRSSPVATTRRAVFKPHAGALTAPGTGEKRACDSVQMGKDTVVGQARREWSTAASPGRSRAYPMGRRWIVRTCPSIISSRMPCTSAARSQRITRPVFVGHGLRHAQPVPPRGSRASPAARRHIAERVVVDGVGCQDPAQFLFGGPWPAARACCSRSGADFHVVGRAVGQVTHRKLGFAGPVGEQRCHGARGRPARRPDFPGGSPGPASIHRGVSASPSLCLPAPRRAPRFRRMGAEQPEAPADAGGLDCKAWRYRSRARSRVAFEIKVGRGSRRRSRIGRHCGGPSCQRLVERSPFPACGSACPAPRCGPAPVGARARSIPRPVQ